MYNQVRDFAFDSFRSRRREVEVTLQALYSRQAPEAPESAPNDSDISNESASDETVFAESCVNLVEQLNEDLSRLLPVESIDDGSNLCRETSLLESSGTYESVTPENIHIWCHEISRKLLKDDVMDQVN